MSDFENKFPIIEGYDIDHKIPITWFDKDVPINIVNALDNLQIMKSIENVSKSNRYSHPVCKEFYSIVYNWILPEYREMISCID